MAIPNSIHAFGIIELLTLYVWVTEVEDTHHRVAFLDGGAVFNLPIFYLEGIVDILA